VADHSDRHSNKRSHCGGDADSFLGRVPLDSGCNGMGVHCVASNNETKGLAMTRGYHIFGAFMGGGALITGLTRLDGDKSADPLILIAVGGVLLVFSVYWAITSRK
jgi:hypothetical protein